MKKCLFAIIIASACWGALIGLVAVGKWTPDVPAWAVGFPLGSVVGAAWDILEHKMEVR